MDEHGNEHDHVGFADDAFGSMDATLREKQSLYGCQTKMLIGRGCHEEHTLTRDEIERAKSFVARPEGIAFVGTLERYLESVCLFHAQYGGPLFSFEVFIDRPDADRVDHAIDFAEQTNTISHATAEKLRRKAMHPLPDASSADDFSGGSADPDNEIYEIAQDRFEAELEQNRDAVTECMARATRWSMMQKSMEKKSM